MHKELYIKFKSIHNLKVMLLDICYHYLLNVIPSLDSWQKKHCERLLITEFLNKNMNMIYL